MSYDKNAIQRWREFYRVEHALDQQWQPHADRIEYNSYCCRLLREMGSKQAMIICDAVALCRESRPCGNAACDMCGVAMQRAIHAEINARWEDEPLVHITLIPPIAGTFLVPMGGLGSRRPRGAENWLRILLAELEHPLGDCIGFQDLQHRVDSRHGTEHWSLHFHLVTPKAGTDGLTRTLSRALPKHPSVRRPVMIRHVMSEEQKAYVGKPRPGRSDRFATLSKGKDRHSSALRKAQLVEALMWLGRFSVMDRVIDLNADSELSQFDE